jgi:glutaryl-CoA dehydrogenase
MWITDGTMADVAIIWARLEDGIRGFLVESGTSGFQASPIRRKFSLEAVSKPPLVAVCTFCRALSSLH